MAATLTHPSLGSIKGVKPANFPSVEQYLGIQYATLAGPFDRGVLVEKPAGPIVATATGPLPVADPKNCANEQMLFQHTLPTPEYKFSATECLTLNVTVPAASKAAGPLPVIAFIHGGGFVTGSANWPQYEMGTIVERSQKLGQPVIVVAINYRLGAFGFLASTAMKEAGYHANNGIHDQKLGLQWIQKNIAGFGGDPTKVTFLGSSAGAASGFFHLQNTEPLFSQLIALGGSPLITPFPYPVADMIFGIVTNMLGIAALSPAEQVKAIVNTPPTELLEKLAALPMPLGAVADGDLIKTVPSYTLLEDAAALDKLLPGTAWCKTLLIEDGQLDGMIIPMAHRQDNVNATLKASLEAVFADAPATAAGIVDGFAIDPAKSGDDKMPVIKFINDVSFAEGIKRTAKAWAGASGKLGTTVYLGHFNLPNPWDGPFKGHAGHALDMAIALGNFNQFLGAGQKAAAEAFAADLITFVNGKAPWPAYSGKADGTAKVIAAGIDSAKDESKVVSTADTSATGRRTIIDGVIGGDVSTLEKLMGAFMMFMQGGPK